MLYTILLFHFTDGIVSISHYIFLKENKKSKTKCHINKRCDKNMVYEIIQTQNN
jgi:hypothetical protein